MRYDVADFYGKIITQCRIIPNKKKKKATPSYSLFSHTIIFMYIIWKNSASMFTQNVFLFCEVKAPAVYTQSRIVYRER